MRLLMYLTLSFVLTGCNLVDNIAETQKQADATALILEKQIGTKPKIGWDIDNGTLMRLNVSFETAKISAFSVADIESKVRQATLEGFTKKPKELVVSFISIP